MHRGHAPGTYIMDISHIMRYKTPKVDKIPSWHCRLYGSQVGKLGRYCRAPRGGILPLEVLELIESKFTAMGQRIAIVAFANAATEGT